RLWEMNLGELLHIWGLTPPRLAGLLDSIERYLAGPKPDEILTAAAARLRDLPCAQLIRVDDLRLGKSLAPLARGDHTLTDIAGRIASRSRDPQHKAFVLERLHAIEQRISDCSQMSLEQELASLATAVGQERRGAIFAR